MKWMSFCILTIFFRADDLQIVTKVMIYKVTEPIVMTDDRITTKSTNMTRIVSYNGVVCRACGQLLRHDIYDRH